MLLNWQEARAFVEENRVQGWEEQRLRDIAALPAALRPFAWGLMGRDEEGGPVDSQTPNVYGLSVPIHGAALSFAQAQQLDALSPAERLQVFTALFPYCAPAVEAAWQLQKEMPYLVSSFRRAFRSPYRPEQTLHRRVRWMEALLGVTRGLEKDVIWLVQHAAYLGRYWQADQLGILFAGAIERGDETGEQVMHILLDTARGEAAQGVMGRHVPQALLSASRPEGWEAMEQLLLTAQRQEGLRQTILETVDQAHPEAFRRMVHLVRRQNLVRFNSVVRAIDVWLGLGWTTAETRQVQRIIEQLDDMLADEAVCQAALAAGDPQQLYIALCIQAFHDALAAVPLATPYLEHGQVEYRFVAAYFLAQLYLPEAVRALLARLSDSDLRVATVSLRGIVAWADREEMAPNLFERLEDVLPRFPAKTRALQSLFWPWLSLRTGRQEIAHALACAVGDRPLSRLKPYINLTDPWTRTQLVGRLKPKEKQPFDETQRELLIRFLGDASPQVRGAALEIAQSLTITPAEAEQLETYLKRKAADLRHGLLRLLLNQPDDNVLASAGRLLGAIHPLQRQAGEELLREMQKAERSVAHCQALATRYQLDQEPPAAAETSQPAETVTLETGLGLYDPADLTPTLQLPKPKRWGRKPVYVTPAAKRCLQSLDELIHQYRELPVLMKVSWNSQQPEREELLGNTHGLLAWPDPHHQQEPEVVRYPLVPICRQWYEERPAGLRDKDGLELIRALAPLLGATYYSYGAREEKPQEIRSLWNILYGGVEPHKLRYASVVRELLWWLVQSCPVPQATEPILDAAEATLSLLSARLKEESLLFDWGSNLSGWIKLARQYRERCPAAWQGEQDIRLWQIIRKLQEIRGAFAVRPYLQELMYAYRAGGAKESDILAYLIGPPAGHQHWNFAAGFNELRSLSGRKLPRGRAAPLQEDQVLQKLVDRCRRRIVEIESQRGDLPTPASQPALALRYSGGLDALIPLLQAMGQDTFVRGWSFYGGSGSRPNVLSHLIRNTFPGEQDTIERFAAEAEQAGIDQQRLVELAMYAPQWANHVAAALNWPAFAAGVWWFHAHTKDKHWQVEDEIRDAWAAEIQEHTPLSGPELMDGAVDVAWFWQAYEAMGEERWQILDRAAKYISGGQGHKRAQLFADAMRGRISEGELTQRIRQKRYQDGVRALGLLPLPQGPSHETELLRRYLLIQEFVRGSRKFGSQRQASERLAAQIAQENLARTAGYTDPLRLQWVMERHAIADLAAGPVSATVQDTTVTLAIDEWGEPQLTVSKKNRILKTVSARLKRDEQVATLLQRKKELQRQVSRTRQALEQAMCRGDHFTAAELAQLFTHPILRPMLSQLLFVGDDVIGYSVKEGRALEGLDGRLQQLSNSTALRIAHPDDLFQDGRWHLWQRECFRHERIQPFKQIFRELYILTAAEQEAGNISRRYAGHEVNPRQALALLGSRGWVGHPDVGIYRTFYQEGITVWLLVEGGYYYTPADVGGMVLEGIQFTRRGEWQTLNLADIPPRLFSEVMRDVDLVVSVAHMGGVDPEAAVSTVEMRAALVRETCDLLKLNNVRLQKNHALVTGKLNNYTIHLGSGVVHQQPGGYLCIIPVHTGQRGRLFLPFVDDDPKSAEIVSKVLLLARDHEVKDPTILEQITAVR